MEEFHTVSTKLVVDTEQAAIHELEQRDGVRRTFVYDATEVGAVLPAVMEIPGLRGIDVVAPQNDWETRRGDAVTLEALEPTSVASVATAVL